MIKKYFILLIFLSFCSNYNTQILIINCPTDGFIQTQRNYHNLKYRIIAGKTNVISLEEKIYKNNVLLSEKKQSSNKSPIIKKQNAKEFIINLEEESGTNSYIVEINITDENENYLSDSCDINFDLP